MADRRRALDLLLEASGGSEASPPVVAGSATKDPGCSGGRGPGAGGRGEGPDAVEPRDPLRRPPAPPEGPATEGRLQAKEGGDAGDAGEDETDADGYPYEGEGSRPAGPGLPESILPDASRRGFGLYLGSGDAGASHERASRDALGFRSLGSARRTRSDLSGRRLEASVLLYYFMVILF